MDDGAWALADGVKIEEWCSKRVPASMAGLRRRLPSVRPTPRSDVVTPDLTEDDLALDRSLRPKRLGDYLGQTKIRSRLPS